MAASKTQKWKGATNWKLLTTLWKLYEKILDLESKQAEEKLSQSHGDYIKYLVVGGKVKTKWVPTKENITNIMTIRMAPLKVSVLGHLSQYSAIFEKKTIL